VHSPRPPAHIAGGVRGSAARYASRPSKKPALPPRVRSAPIPRDLVGGELFKRGIRSVERARHVRAGALLPGDATCAGRRVSSHGREVITEERSPCHGSISLASPGKSSGREGSRRGTSRRQRDPSPPPPARPPARPNCHRLFRPDPRVSGFTHVRKFRHARPAKRMQARSMLTADVFGEALQCARNLEAGITSDIGTSTKTFET